MSVVYTTFSLPYSSMSVTILTFSPALNQYCCTVSDSSSGNEEVAWKRVFFIPWPVIYAVSIFFKNLQLGLGLGFSLRVRVGVKISSQKNAHFPRRWINSIYSEATFLFRFRL